MERTSKFWYDSHVRFLLIAWLAASSAFAQWPQREPKNAPRKADGSIDPTGPAPRTAAGQPDLSGIWEPGGEFEMPKYLLNLAADRKEPVPFRPEAEALYKQRQATNSVDHPGARCLPSGIPEKDAVPAPFKILQMPDLVVILYESRTIFRQIFTDGRPLPVDPVPTWQGYSTGRWDQDTLVVETAGFNDRTWLDMAGHPATDALHVTERFHRRDYGHMDIDITINDPKAYTEPWGAHETVRLRPTDELMEHICEENNRDPAHMVGK